MAPNLTYLATNRRTDICNVSIKGLAEVTMNPIFLANNVKVMLVMLDVLDVQ